MPWNEVSIVAQREEFVMLSQREDSNVRRMCRRFQISPTTAYKWLDRYRRRGREGLEDLSRRPLTTPERSSLAIEQAVVDLRREFPAWGARKLRRVMLNPKRSLLIPGSSEPGTVF